MNTKFSESLKAVQRGVSPCPMESPSVSTSTPEPQIVSSPEVRAEDLPIPSCSQPEAITLSELSTQTETIHYPEPLPSTRSSLFSRFIAKVKAFLK